VLLQILGFKLKFPVSELSHLTCKKKKKKSIASEKLNLAIQKSNYTV